MADETTKKSGISPGVIVTGAAGLGLIIFGLMKLKGPQASAINAKFAFDYQGPAMDVKFRVRFGDIQPLGVFIPNDDLTHVSGTFHIPACVEPTHQECNVKVIIPAKATTLWNLPYTYSGEAMILDTNNNLIDDDKVLTTNVFTHTEKFEVVMQ
jgi:hypothetical protein